MRSIAVPSALEQVCTAVIDSSAQEPDDKLLVVLFEGDIYSGF